MADDERGDMWRDGNCQEWLDDLISLEKLQGITGQQDLETVTSLSTLCNTDRITLASIGNMLTSLERLSLTRSVVRSLTVFGPSFASLTHLYVDQCRLETLEGVGLLPALTHLLASQNAVTDLQPLCECDTLEVLDLRSNNVHDPAELMYIGIPPLTHVALAGNPVQRALGERYITEVESHLDPKASVDALPYNIVFMRSGKRGGRPLTSARSLEAGPLVRPSPVSAAPLTQSPALIAGSPSRALKTRRRARSSPNLRDAVDENTSPRIARPPGLAIKPPSTPIGSVAMPAMASPLARGGRRFIVAGGG